MKNLILTSFGWGISYSILCAQNVGIGTNTPAARLDVKSSSNYVSQFNGVSPMYIGLFENDVYRGYIGSYSGAEEDMDVGTGQSNATGKLHLTTTAVPRLTINSTGQVGIGLTNPSHLLHIGGDLFIESSVGKIILGYETGGSQWRLGTTGPGTDIRWYTYDGVTEKPVHYFRQNGDVGIGTGIPVPLAKLEVRGTGTTSSTNTFILRNNYGDTLLRMRDDGRMGIGYNGNTFGRQLNLGGAGINFYTANEAAFGGAVFPTDTSLVLWSNSNSNNYLVLQPSWGNTGIGTYTPNAKLHLNGTMLIGNNSQRTATGYSLSVDGKVIAEDFTTLNSTAWPDYVFEKDYPLMSLQQVKQYIDSYKHLPGVPDAATIEKNGFRLGEMVKKLVEKTEELTVYILELERQNNELQQRVIKLENK